MDRVSRRIWVVRITALGLAAAAGAGMTYFAPEALVPIAPLVAVLVWYGVLQSTGTMLRRWEPYPHGIPDAPAAKWTKSQVLAIRVAGFAAAMVAAGGLAYYGPENIRALGGLVGILLIQAIFYGAGVPLERWENPYPSSNALGDALRNTGNEPEGLR